MPRVRKDKRYNLTFITDYGISPHHPKTLSGDKCRYIETVVEDSCREFSLIKIEVAPTRGNAAFFTTCFAWRVGLTL